MSNFLKIHFRKMATGSIYGNHHFLKSHFHKMTTGSIYGNHQKSLNCTLDKRKKCSLGYFSNKTLYLIFDFPFFFLFFDPGA